MKSILIFIAGIFLLASCTGKSKKVNEAALWDEKPQQAQTVTAKAETPEVAATTVDEPTAETSEMQVTETKAEKVTTTAEKPQEQKAENLDEETNDNKIYEKPEQSAFCPLDDNEMVKFVQKHFEMPKSFYDKPFNARGTAYLTIEKDGSISNVEIIPSISPDMDKEYIRVAKLLPKFTPAKVKGKPVRSKWSMAVRALAM